MISVYDPKETNFEHNGLAILSPKSCTVTEELNGPYELEMVHPVDKYGKWKHIVNFSVIKAPTPKHGQQLFRVYQPGKVMGDGVHVNARHIFYDLIYNYVESCGYTNLTASEAMQKMLSCMAYPTSFSVGSDINARFDGGYSYKTPIEIIMGDETSIMHVFGGELERDNFNIALKTSIGQDNGAVVRYGKNLMGLDMTENVENVVTRIKPYCTTMEGYMQATHYLPEVYADSERINDYPFPMVQCIEINGLTGDVVTAMRQKVAEMFADGVDLPKINLKVDFANLEKTTAYAHFKALETINLGDIVTVDHAGLDVSVKAKCIKYDYDCLNQRYNMLELGQPKADLSETTLEVDRGVGKISGVDLMAQGIAHDLGGSVVKRYGELLAMDAADVSKAKKIWKWDANGLSYSRSGYTGKWHKRLDMDGKVYDVPLVD